MSWKTTVRGGSWLVLPFLLVGIWPTVAAAQRAIMPPAIPPGSNAVLYEVLEDENAKPLLQPHDPRRVATAALLGSVSVDTSICPAAMLATIMAMHHAECTLTATATDNTPLATGKGPVVGTFAVTLHEKGSIDSPELMIVRGTLRGQIDLSPALLQGVPLGFISGRWSATVVRGGPWQAAFARLKFGGTFTGTFRLPFVSPLDPMQTPLYLINPKGPIVVPIAANEYAAGWPTVRLELNFVETNQDDDQDDDR